MGTIFSGGLLSTAGSVVATTYSIPVSTYSIGDKAVDTLAAGFTNPLDSVVSDGAGGKFFRSKTGAKVCAITTASARDVEVNTWCKWGTVFIRMTGALGSQTGWYFSTQTNPTYPGTRVDIGIFTGFNTGTSDFETSGARGNMGITVSDLAGSAEGIAAGYSTTYTSGDYFTFGASGFEIYLKFNGTDIFRFKDLRRVNSGTVALATVDSQGFYDTTVYMPGDATLYSVDPVHGVIDIRDFGAEAVQTTGTISASSTSLTVASVGNLRVGDSVIVAVGGESGAGLRNSDGVGGTWPSLHYATTAAMNADNSKPNGTYAYPDDTGIVYVYGGTWDLNSSAFSLQRYYVQYKLPRALRAVITNISGNVLTLDTAASVTATSANVYKDCYSAFYWVLENDPEADDGIAYPTPIRLNIPAGTFAIGEQVNGGNREITVSGQGNTSILFSPPGVQSLEIVHTNSAAGNAPCNWQDVKFVSNHGTDGFFPRILGSPETPAIPEALRITFADNSVIRRLTFVNTWGTCVTTGNSDAVLIDSCSLTMSASQQCYNGWSFQIADSDGGTISNCTAVGTTLLKAFEIFRSDNCTISNCGGTNVLFAANTNGHWLYEDCYSNISAGSYSNEGSGSIFEAVFSISSNIDNFSPLLAYGGELRNAKVVQSGYVRASDSSSVYQVVVNQYNTNVSITGGYPQCPVGTDYGGYFEGPDWNGASATFGPVIISTATNTIIDGIRQVGVGHPIYDGISATAVGDSVTDCVSDGINATSSSGNQTNADYIASC